jgi:UDP-N-acetylmuramyl tripeptide synthase
MDKTSISLLERLRLVLALTAGQLVAFFCRLFGYTGTSLPGAVALRVCPRIIALLAPAYERVIAVTGTNGKTTTANLLAHFLRFTGCTVANNAEGANMLPGVVAALIRDCTLTGRPRSRVALLEVDEGSVGNVLPDARPDLVVVTNYFRDQLDRYCELERTIALLRRTLAEIPETSLLLNADDPLVAGLGCGWKNVSYFGVSPDGVEAEVSGEVRESGYCPQCGTLLAYHCYYYGQLGEYYCPQCDFSRPKLQFAAARIVQDDYLSFDLIADFPFSTEKLLLCTLKAPLRGFYNTYNILAAAAAAVMSGVSLDEIKRSLLEYRTVTGRMEEFIFQNRPCTLALIKNPTGVNEVLKTVLSTDKEKALVIAINDLAADGRDVSWLWDANFALLDDPLVRKIICAGRRAGDLAVCLKYAGVAQEVLALAPDPGESLKILGEQDVDEFYVLVSYTILFEYAGLLKSLGEGGKKNAP